MEEKLSKFRQKHHAWSCSGIQKEKFSVTLTKREKSAKMRNFKILTSIFSSLELLDKFKFFNNFEKITAIKHTIFSK